MHGDPTPIVARELAKGIRKLKNKLGARQLAPLDNAGDLNPADLALDSAEETAAAAGSLPEVISLLWPPGYTAPAAGIKLDDVCIRDLALEETISSIVTRSLGKECRPAVEKILLHLCADPTVIQYRQNVIDDLLHSPGLVTGLEQLLTKITSLDQYGQADEQEVSLYRVTWWLGELEIYLDCIKLLGRIFGEVGQDLNSAGLRGLRDAVAGIERDRTFENLERELPGLLARMRGITSITIGVNLNDRLQPVEATLIAVNEEKYTEAPLLKMLLGKTSSQEGVMPIHAVPKVTANPNNPFSPVITQSNPLMMPLFRDLAQVMERVSEPVAQALKKYIQLNRRFLASLGPELAFYLGAVKMLQDLTTRGLPVCRPELACPEERVCEIENNYNLNLALHLLDWQGQPDLAGLIVKNEVSMGPAGRILILTGPNRGGKTTYAQAIGLSQVLAQTGLYVPGTRARLSLVDGIYTHYPVEEKLEKGTGRFGDEAKRLHDIFTRATRSSLILLNESLSGTAAGESLYLTRDIVRILRRMGLRAIFATHLHELAASVDRLNDDTPGDSQIISLVASLVEEEVADPVNPAAPIRRSYKVVASPPMGHSYAREIARRYGISFEQLSELLNRRGIKL